MCHSFNDGGGLMLEHIVGMDTLLPRDITQYNSAPCRPDAGLLKPIFCACQWVALHAAREVMFDYPRTIRLVQNIDRIWQKS